MKNNACDCNTCIYNDERDSNEWVKRSDVLRVIDKLIDERLSELYKGMTNGEIIKTVFDVDEIQIVENRVIVRVKGSFCAKMQFILDWWTAKYGGE